jgi:hypothetical protein
MSGVYNNDVKVEHVKKFKRLNYIAGIIQFILCIFLCFWFCIEIVSDVNNDVLQFNIGEYTGNGKGRSFGNIPVSCIVALLAIFTCITSCVHIFGYARAGSSYQDSVDNGKNWKRWVEYSITATIMMIVIALSSGTCALDTMVLVVVATFCCMVCGWISEETAKSHTKVSKISTLIGWLLLLSVIGVVMRRFTSIVKNALKGEGPPWWVFGIVISMFLLYSSFGFIHLFHMNKQWNDTVETNIHYNRKIEGAYTITSMIAKITLVVFLASGLFAREASV